MGEIKIQDRRGLLYLVNDWPEAAGLSIELLVASTRGIYVHRDRITFRFANAEATYQVVGFEDGALMLRLLTTELLIRPQQTNRADSDNTGPVEAPDDPRAARSSRFARDQGDELEGDLQ